MRDTTEQLVLSSATDYGQIVKLFQLAMQTLWFSGRLALQIFWSLVSDTGAGGAGTTRESDSQVGPAHVA